jgi:asparaginyl-tRNA synthetase
MSGPPIASLTANSAGTRDVEIVGWIASRRLHAGVLFLDLVDSSGSIQVVIARAENPRLFEEAQSLAPEAAIRVRGNVLALSQEDSPELRATSVELIGDVAIDLSPRPRSDFDIFSSRHVDHVLRNRHLYLRNNKLMAVMKVRHEFFGALHNWFHQHRFIEIHAPLLTQIPLYEAHTAFTVDFFGHPVFLNQCVGFYLESAVAAFERVYNVGPSFRAEDSKSRRHLAEYWHVKAEVAFADLEGIITTVEALLPEVLETVTAAAADELKLLATRFDCGQFATPLSRITYDEAIKIIEADGQEANWGDSLSNQDLTVIARKFDGPFWITGMPRTVEPFPYVVDPQDQRVTRTADLIAPAGFGELLGVAEKIADLDQLRTRMIEKGLENDPRYDWFKQLRQYGNVPHSGMGMGVERVLRWFLGLSHVRDVIPFPRLFGRLPYP